MGNLSIHFYGYNNEPDVIVYMVVKDIYVNGAWFSDSTYDLI